MPPIRASEPDGFLTTLPDPFWVECPRCGKPARVVRKPHRYRMRADATVTCGHCSFRHEDAELYRALHSGQVYVRGWHPRCESCGGDKFDFARAQVSRHGEKISIRSRCEGCGRANDFAGQGALSSIREGHDHWFGLPLVLKADYRSHLVWAYNLEHIDLLEGWIKADLRERSLNAHYMTMAARLPAWMKAAHAREPVLKALEKMREFASREGLS